MISRFIRKAFIFFLPILLLAMIPIRIGLYTGELLPVAQIIRLQEEEDALYRPGATQSDVIDYKLRVALHQQADFLVFGSSRFRYLSSSIVTNPEYHFYNASVLGPSPQHMLAMLEVLAQADAMPRILYLNIDLNHLNADCNQNPCISDFDIRMPDTAYEFQRLIDAYGNLSLDLLLAPQTIQDNMTEVRATASAYSLGRGQADYRSDGSVQTNWTPEIVENGLNGFETMWVERIRMFQIGDEVSQDALVTYEEIINLTEAHDTRLIAVLPPFHPDFYERLQSSPEHQYFEPARQAIVELFARRDNILLDFTDPETSAVEADMFYDAWHLGDVGSLQLYVEVINRYPEILTSISNPEILNEMLANAPTSLSLRQVNLP